MLFLHNNAEPSKEFMRGMDAEEARLVKFFMPVLERTTSPEDKLSAMLVAMCGTGELQRMLRERERRDDSQLTVDIAGELQDLLDAREDEEWQARGQW